jgi:hypothetical protein
MARKKRAAHNGREPLQAEALLAFVDSEPLELKALSQGVDEKAA